MFKKLKRTLTASWMILLFSACSSQTKLARLPSSEGTPSGTPATLVQITESRLRSYIQELITPNSVLTKISDLQIYPRYNLVALKANLSVPKNFIPTFTTSLNPPGSNEVVDLELQIALQPFVEQQNEHSVLRLKLISVDIDGVDLSKQIGIIPQVDKFIFLILSQTPLRNWMDQTTLPVIGSKFTLSQLSQLYSELKSKKTFSVENSEGLAIISIQLANIKNIAMEAFKPNAQLSKLFESYRVWHVGTQALPTFNLPSIIILTGDGLPDQKQLALYEMHTQEQIESKSRLESENDLLSLKLELTKTMTEKIEKSNLSKSDKSYVQSQLQTQIEIEVERKKILIFANSKEYVSKIQQNFLKLTEQAIHFQLNQDSFLEAQNKTVNDTASDFLISKIISEKLITNQLRYFKNLFTYQNQQIFSKLDLKLYPDKNVVRLRGRFNTTTLLKLITKEVIADALIDPKKYGNSIPFYFDFRINMADLGVLRLTPLKLSLLDGESSFEITAYHKHSKIIFDLVENLLLNSIPELVVNLPQLSNLNEFLAKSENLRKQQKQIIDVINNSNKSLDIIKNYSKHKKLFYTDKLSLDLSSEKVKSTLLSLITKKQNSYLLPINTDIFTKLGLNLPIKDQHLASFDLIDSKDTQSENMGLKVTFTDKKSSKLPQVASNHTYLGNGDVHLLTNLSELSQNINGVLNKANLTAQQELQRLQLKETEYDEFLFSSLNLKPVDNEENVLAGVGVLNRERFQKKNLFARTFGSNFKLDSDRLELSFKVKLSVEENSEETFKQELSMYKRTTSDLNSHIRVELLSVGLKSSEHTNLLSLTKIAGVDMSQVDLKNPKWVVRTLKKPIFNALRRIFDSQDEGNTKLGKLKLNKLLRVILLKDDLVILLNPRLVGPDFEVDLLKNSSNNKNLSVKSNTLNVLLKSYVGFNKADEEELFDLIDNLQNYKSAIASINSVPQLKELVSKQKLYSSLVHNKNSFQSAYYKYLFQKISQFPALIKILRNTADPLKESIETGQDRLLSMTGIELTYFATAFNELNQVLTLFQNKIISLKAADQILDLISSEELADITKKIHFITSIILPALKNEYKIYYHPYNLKEVSEQKITDWNENYILEMNLAESLYKFLKSSDR
jgi:hypothetical protein